MACIAKFDTGSDDDWMSKRLALEIGVELEEARPLLCQNFDGSHFISDLVANNVTWMHDKNTKTICGTFRIGQHTSYEVVIGKRTLFDEKIYSTGEKIRDAGVLVTKKISKGMLLLYIKIPLRVQFVEEIMMQKRQKKFA